MSAAATAAGSSSQGRGVPPVLSARRTDRSQVRLTTVIARGCCRATVAAARPLIAPAPTMSTWASRTAPTYSVAAASPSATSPRPACAMSVSLWARLPTRSACWNRAFSAGPAVPPVCAASSASRSWPRICGSPTAIDSSPQAREKTCAIARSS